MPAGIMIDGDFRTQNKDFGPGLAADGFGRVAQCIVWRKKAEADDTERECEQCEGEDGPDDDGEKCNVSERGGSHYELVIVKGASRSMLGSVVARDGPCWFRHSGLWIHRCRSITK